jgi:hypothetical protein
MLLWILLLLPFVQCGAFLHDKPRSMLGNRNSGDWIGAFSSSSPSSPRRRRTNGSRRASVSKKTPTAPLRLAVEDQEDLRPSDRKNNDDDDDNNNNRSHRRRHIATAAASATAAAWLAANIPPASAAPPPDATLPLGLLEARVTENVLSPPPYLMEIDDIYYPSWFAGTWQVRSVCTDIMAPCDTVLFGGETKYQNAQKDISKPILYESRFLPVMTVPSPSSSVETKDDDTGVCIADREFNVVSIAKATMGNASIVNVATSTPNRLSVLLALGGGSGSSGDGGSSNTGGGGGLIQADLITLHRRQERIDNTRFDCAEAVQEVVSYPKSSSSSSAGPLPGPMILKQIETASLYRLVQPPGNNKNMIIQCRQRSATFLLPSQKDPVALRLWQMARGRPIDVRFYDVTYSR